MNIIKSMCSLFFLAALGMSMTGGTGGTGLVMGDGRPIRGDVASGYLSVPDGRLYYEIAGEGEWIVLVHDGNLHSATWDEQFLVFAKDHKVVRYDRRGYGKSDYPKKPYSNVDDLAEVFRQLNIDKAVLMGMSAGGGLVIDFALEYPDKVSGMVLVGAVVSGLGYSDHMRTRGGNLKPSDRATPLSMADYMCHRDPYTFYERNVEAKKKGFELLKNNLQNYDLAKFDILKGPKRPALPNLKEIKVPALIIVGEYDIPDCHAHAGAIEAGISGSSRIVIKNAGHIVPMEQPAEFNRIVVPFVREIGFFGILKNKGVEEALRSFKEAREKNDPSVYFSENALNQTAYQYLQGGRIKEAVRLFGLNALAYPDSWNVYDSLAEALLADGNKEQSILNYEKSLKLNPGNVNAAEQLKKLKK